MPRGLPDVVQKFTADVSGYLAGIQSMIAANEEFVSSIDQAIRKIGELESAIRGIGDKTITVRVRYEEGQAPDVPPLIEQVVRRSFEGETGEAPPPMVEQVVRRRIEMDDTQLAAGLRTVDDASDRMGRLSQMIAEANRVLSGGEALKSVEDQVKAANDLASAEYKAAMAERMRANTQREAAAASERSAAATDRAAAAAERQAAAGRTLQRQIEATGLTADRIGLSAQQGMIGYGTSFSAAGGTFDAARRDLLLATFGGAAPPGGGGRGPFLGGLLGNFGGGGRTAGETADIVGGFLRTWYPRFHWAMMITNELLATVGPALVAGGAAGAVGLQGGEQLMFRYNALANTAEALGGAYGVTPGSFMGIGSALQRAQNYAEGGTYGLAGGLLNIAGMGSGAFTQQGIGTLAMMDRGMANLVLGMQQRGTAGKLATIMGGGTDYLRQFGDVFGNIGQTFMNVAPNLPGVGGDLLSTLQGATGLLRWGSGVVPGGVLGSALAFEAGTRYGPALIGGLGRLLQRTGGGLADRALMAGIDPLTGMATEAAGAGVSEGLLGLGGGLGAVGDVLAGITGPEVGAMAVAAFLGGKLISSMPSPTMRRISALQAGVNAAGFSAAFQPLGKAIMTASTAGIGAPTGIRAEMGSMETTSELMRFGPGVVGGPTNMQLWRNAAEGFNQQMANLINSGPQLVSTLQSMGLHGTTMAQAFQIGQNALLDLGHAFDKSGHLNKTAIQQLADYTKAFIPMTRTGGGFIAAMDAQQIMSTSAMQSLSKINQSMDAMTSIMTGGPAGMASLFGMLGGTPIARRQTRSGLQLTAPPGYGKFAQALTSFTSAGGAAAWNTFAGSQGLIAAEQQNLDQLRTAMTLGAIGPQGAAGLAGFQIEQMLPMAKKSPAALAMLMSLGAQMGIGQGQPGGGYYQQGLSQKQNYQNAVAAFAGIADSSKQANAATNDMTIKLANLPQVAKQFSQSLTADITSKQVAQAATDTMTMKKAADKGLVDKSALKDFQAQLSAAGVTGAGALKASLDAALKQAGVGAKMRVKIEAQMDTNQAQAAIAKLTHITNQPKVNVKADVAAAQAAINAIKGKNVSVPVRQQGAAAVQAAIDAIHGKNVTVTITTINRLITQAVGAGLINTAGGFSLAGGGGTRIMPGGHKTGGLVPGSGVGDIVPAMLEPGEAVVPRHLVPAVSGFLGAHKVPGFAGGGFVGQQVPGPGAYWGAGSGMSLWNPALLAQILAAMRASQGVGIFDHPQGFRGLMAGGGGSGGGNLPSPAQAAAQAAAAVAAAMSQAAKGSAGEEFGVEILKGITGHVKNLSADASSLAKALVNKIQQEVKYAQGVAGAAAYGQGYDPTGKGSGIFGGMNLASPSGLTQAQLHASPTGNIKDYNAYVAAYAADTVGGPGPQSVQDQMKSYLSTLRSFSTDIGKLRKEHLSKDVMSQIIAAGPQQGDLIAQSILGGQGGAGAVNKIWAQIQKASKGLGAQAAMAQFGGTLAPNLKSGTFINNNVSISVSAGGSGGLAGMSEKDLRALIQKIQAALLKQAKRNNKTGVKAHGKNA